MTLAGGLIGITQQASQVILINLSAFAYQTGWGMQSPGCTLVGLMIGKSDVHNAIEYTKAVIVVFCFILTLQVFIFVFF